MKTIKEIFSSKGVALMELLITIIITGILLTAAFKIYLTQQKGWIVQTQVSDMQHSARVSLRELTHKIRMAGYELPDGIDAITPKNTNPDTIIITFCTIEPCDANLEHSMPLPSSELRCDGNDLTCFQADEWAYIYDPNTKTGEFFYITKVQYSAGHIQLNTMSLSKAYPESSTVMEMEQVKYYVDNTTNPDLPCLMMQEPGQNPIIYASGVEDLQFIYTLADGSTSDEPASPDLIREVQITLTTRTQRKDLQFEGDYRRRVLSSKVNVRNLNL